MAACPSSCGYGKNVGSSGHCRLDQTSGNAPASSLDRSSTTSLRQPDEVGLTLWDQGTGLNTLKGPSYPAWGVAPCVELGWGIHILHGAQPPCLISIGGSTALPHLHLWRRYCLIPQNIFTEEDIKRAYTLGGKIAVKDVEGKAEWKEEASFTRLRPVVIAYGEGEHRFAWEFTSQPTQEIDRGSKRVAVILEVPHGTDIVLAVITYQLEMQRKSIGEWVKPSVQPDPPSYSRLLSFRGN